MSTVIIAQAHCIGRCEWTAAASWAHVDREAEAHTRKAGHPTATVAAPKTSAGSPRQHQRRSDA